MDHQDNDNPFASRWVLDPDIRFLNHGSFGACPIEVLDYQTELRDRMERQPVQFFVRDLEPMLDTAREELGAFIGAPAATLAWVPNATAGVNAVLRSMRLEPGDELLTTDHEYNACRNVLEYVARREQAAGIVPSGQFPLSSPEDVIEAIMERVTPRTRLALLDHITSQTGMILPIERLVAELSARGIETLVDGAHAPGLLDLAVAFHA